MALPQLSGPFITDGGIETDLIFHRGFELPHFAAFVLLDDAAGRRALREYYREYVALAREHDIGLLLDTPTWRASSDWASVLGYSTQHLAELNRAAVALLEGLRDARPEIVISGCVGPRSDGYRPETRMSAGEAEAYHAAQIETFAGTSADLVTALTLTHSEEAIGIVRAAQAADIPVAISFTVETDGRLPDGQPLHEAIGDVDRETDAAAAYFMINCAHPSHFQSVLMSGAPALQRVRGIRANASIKSHAELDESDELDEGDPEDLARRYRELGDDLPQLTLWGGCCGTDRRHLAAICAARAA
jgi:homocysteine S-methyltransferase